MSMVNDVLDAISVGLNKVFGSDYRYYVEDVPQKLKTPCFTIESIDYTVRSYNKTSYYITVPVVIQFYPENEVNSKKHSYDIGNQIADAVEYISVDGVLLRSENINYQLNDDILQVFLTYRFWTKSKPSYNYMEELKNIIKSI